MPANVGFPYDQIYDAPDIVASPSIACQLVQSLKVLVIGNSITFHPSYASVNWPNEWGMAASVERNDYRHRLATVMANATCSTITLKAASAWLWERDFDTISMALFQVYRDWLPDIFIFRLGDNIANADSRLPVMGIHIRRLADYLNNGRGIKIFTTRVFFDRPNVSAQIQAASAAFGYTYIDFGNLFGDDRNKILFENSAVSPFVADHPGDFGMANIAREIYKTVVPVARTILKPYPVFNGEGSLA